MALMISLCECVCRCCWRPLLPIWSPVLPLFAEQRPARLSACVSTRAEHTTSTHGSSTCCSVRFSHTLWNTYTGKTWSKQCVSDILIHLPVFSLSGLVVPVDEEHSSHLILGVLLTLRYLMPLLQQQAPNTSLKGSFGLVRKEADITPTPEQLIQVPELKKLIVFLWFDLLVWFYLLVWWKTGFYL